LCVSTSSADLSEMLLAGTKESHTKTEISQLGRDFYKGIVKKDVLKVCFLLNCSLYFIYSAMEDELERNKDHPYIAPIYFPTELYRREALAQDLQYFYGVDWESLVTTTLWVKRIHEVGKKDPGMLVAHCYVRYIGDLSGGHLLNNVAKKVLRLPATGDGLRFYQFEGITSHKGFKQLYRSKLNEVDVEMETKLSIVDEAIRAYDYSLLVSERARCLCRRERHLPQPHTQSAGCCRPGCHPCWLHSVVFSESSLREELGVVSLQMEPSCINLVLAL
uniref:heme oxygenase (biliverdin-producing) n=1 Tax=Poecilia mexicana TaxID=48701 RepID=A0A3B3WWU6_9TELE